jgi:hypothetical protein
MAQQRLAASCAQCIMCPPHCPHPLHQWPLPPDNLYFSVIANLSIASLNVSLLVNTVGFYQVRAWLGRAPFWERRKCAVRWRALRRRVLSHALQPLLPPGRTRRIGRATPPALPNTCMPPADCQAAHHPVCGYHGDGLVQAALHAARGGVHGGRSNRRQHCVSAPPRKLGGERAGGRSRWRRGACQRWCGAVLFRPRSSAAGGPVHQHPAAA